MNKKADFQGSVFVVIIIIIVAFASVFVMRLNAEFNSKIQSMDNAPQIAKDSVSSYNTRFIKWVDGGIIFCFVLLELVVLFLALLIPSNIIWLPISLALYFISIFTSFILRAIYNHFSTTELAAQVAQLPWTAYIIDKMPIISSVFGLVIIGLMVTKK